MDGATLYYASKKSFSFERTIFKLSELGISIRHPNTKLITGIDGNLKEFSETDLTKVKNIIYQAKHSGMHLWLETPQTLFGSFVNQNKYFFQHFSFCYLDYDEIEQKISQIFIKFALHELGEVGDEVLCFTLDQFGYTEEYDFIEIFEPSNQKILSSDCIPDLVFLPREKITRITLANKCQIIGINQKFDCIAKNPELADYLKSLL